MSELFPSLTMTIACSIMGVGFAYGFYTLTIRRGFLVTALLLFALLFVFSNYEINRHLLDPKLVSVFLLAMFIGLVSTPVDD